MTQATYNLLDALQRSGLLYGYVFAQDVENTAGYFGTKEEVELVGKYLCIWRKKNADDYIPFIDDLDDIEPEYRIDIDEEEFIACYRLS